jgi:tetratricopeptide (TPR) repeat protein
MLWHARAMASRELSEEDSVEIVRRVVEHYLDFTVARDARLSRRPRLGPRYAGTVELAGAEDRRTILEELETRRETLLEAVLLTEKYQLDDLTWQVCEALWGLYHLHGPYEDWRRTHEIGLRAALRLGDQRVVMRMASQLGSAYLGLREYEKADVCFERSYEAAKQVSGPEGRTGEQSALEWRGKIAAKLGQGDQARQFYDKSEAAARLAPAAEQPRMIALLELQRARLCVGLQCPDDGLRHVTKAKEYFDGTAEEDNKAKAWHVLGSALAGLKRYQESEDALFAALDIFGREGSKRSQIDVLETLVPVAEQVGRKEIVAKSSDALERLRKDLGLE